MSAVMCKSQRVKGSRKGKVASTSSSFATYAAQSHSTSSKSSSTHVKPSVGEERVVSTHSLLQTPVALTVNTTSVASTNTDVHRVATATTTTIIDDKNHMSSESIQDIMNSGNKDNNINDDESAAFGEA